MTVLKDDIEPRKTSRDVLTRNYCRSCKAAVCNDVADEEGNVQRRVRRSIMLCAPSHAPPTPTAQRPELCDSSCGAQSSLTPTPLLLCAYSLLASTRLRPCLTAGFTEPGSTLTAAPDADAACATRGQAFPVQSFQRGSADNAAPHWPVKADIWYSERVVDMKDDIPKWCVSPLDYMYTCAEVPCSWLGYYLLLDPL